MQITVHFLSDKLGLSVLIWHRYYVPHVYTGKNKVTPIHAALHDMPKY